LTLKGDEGRGVATIRSGEVPSNFRSGDLRMRKLLHTVQTLALDVREHTQGSKTFQYLVEKKPIGISLVAASEKEEAQT
jgi:hypothetical protein